MTTLLACLVVLTGQAEPPAEQTVELFRTPEARIEARWALGKPFVVDVRSAALAGVPADRLGTLIRVFATPAGAAVGPDSSPLLGRVESVTSSAGARFVSRFPVERGMSYHLSLAPLGLAPRGSDSSRYATFTIPASDPTTTARRTTVARVAPAAKVLPENLLKFYIEFSGPMSRGEAYDHLRLLDGAGKPIDLPFLELGEELWNPGLTRFTVLFDPGRIKSGLKPREEAGPVLEAGKTYTLVVDDGWPDADGRPLVQPFRKTFRVTKADMTPPDPATWKVEPPAAGTRRPLRVRFPEPLDRGLLGRLLAVVDGQGRAIAGTGQVADDERSWSYTPARPWVAGDAGLLVGRELEDLAGNSIGRPFEVDVFDRIEARVVAETIRLPFRVEPPTQARPGRLLP